MNLSLWMLMAFASWTLLVLLVGVGVYRWTLIFKGQAMLTSFPGDTPHGSATYRRAVRAHANCIENLPVFGAIILTAAVANLAPPQLGPLAAATMAARVVQTSIHTALPESNLTIGVRFSFYTVQALAMIAMTVLIVVAAVARGS